MPQFPIDEMGRCWGPPITVSGGTVPAQRPPFKLSPALRKRTYRVPGAGVEGQWKAVATGCPVPLTPGFRCSPESQRARAVRLWPCVHGTVSLYVSVAPLRLVAHCVTGRAGEKGHALHSGRQRVRLAERLAERLAARQSSRPPTHTHPSVTGPGQTAREGRCSPGLTMCSR